MLDMSDWWGESFCSLSREWVDGLGCRRELGGPWSLHCTEGRGVQENTSMRLIVFPRAQPKGTAETECWYFPVLLDSSQGTCIIQFVKVKKLYP